MDGLGIEPSFLPFVCKHRYMTQELSGENLDEISEAILDFSQPDNLVIWMVNQS
jgi:hypothetical protein